MLAATALLLGGCAMLEPAPAPHVQAEQVIRQPMLASSMLALSDYLAYAQLLSQVRSKEQKKVYQQAVHAFQENPTSHTRLRYALTLEALAGPYSDPRKALHLFKELAASEPPLPREIALLVDMQVQTLKQRLELTDRVAILTKALQDADAKIDALTDIEQSLEPPQP